MNWRRAKTILIYSFLLLDILLATQVWRMVAQPLTTNPYNDFSLEQLTTLLKQEGIVLSVELPTEAADKPLINVRYRETALRPISPPVSANQTKPASLVELVPEMKGTLYDQVQSTKTLATFDQVFEGLPLFRVNIQLKAIDDAWRSAKIQTVTVMSKGTPQPLISSFLAVRTVYERQLLKSGDEIVDVRLGYEGQHFTSDMQVMAPTWRIALISDRRIYVNAVTGGVLNSGVAQNQAVPDNK